MAGKTVGKVNPKTSTKVWYAIMLDYEVELMQGYWPVRGPNTNEKVVEQEYWIVGNPIILPSSGWVAELRANKGLADRNSRRVFSGGLYLFRPVSDDEV